MLARKLCTKDQDQNFATKNAVIHTDQEQSKNVFFTNKLKEVYRNNVY